MWQKLVILNSFVFCLNELPYTLSLAVDCETFCWIAHVFLFCLSLHTCLLYTLLGMLHIKACVVVDKTGSGGIWKYIFGVTMIENIMFFKCCRICSEYKLGFIMKSFWASSVNEWRVDIWHLVCIQISCFKAVQSWQNIHMVYRI